MDFIFHNPKTANSVKKPSTYTGKGRKVTISLVTNQIELYKSQIPAAYDQIKEKLVNWNDRFINLFTAFIAISLFTFILLGSTWYIWHNYQQKPLFILENTLTYEQKNTVIISSLKKLQYKINQLSTIDQKQPNWQISFLLQYRDIEESLLETDIKIYTIYNEIINNFNTVSLDNNSFQLIKEKINTTYLDTSSQYKEIKQIFNTASELIQIKKDQPVDQKVNEPETLKEFNYNQLIIIIEPIKILIDNLITLHQTALTSVKSNASNIKVLI
jgi:hypothetical protein